MASGRTLIICQSVLIVLHKWWWELCHEIRCQQKWIGAPYVYTHFLYHTNHWTGSYLTQHIRFSFDLLGGWVHIHYSVVVLSSNTVYCIINSVWRQYKWQMKAAFGHITCYFGVCVWLLCIGLFIIFVRHTRSPCADFINKSAQRTPIYIQPLLANHYLQNNHPLFAYSREEPSNKSMKLIVLHQVLG
jgi:hypothetical protein